LREWLKNRPLWYKWHEEPNGDVVLWPVVTFHVRLFDTAIGAAIWMVLHRTHLEGVKTGEFDPTYAQLAMTPEQARDFGQRLIKAADTFEGRGVTKN
jgi:hypothetical protein